MNYVETLIGSCLARQKILLFRGKQQIVVTVAGSANSHDNAFVGLQGADIHDSTEPLLKHLARNMELSLKYIVAGFKDSDTGE